MALQTGKVAALMVASSSDDSAESAGSAGDAAALVVASSSDDCASEAAVG